MRLAPVLSIGLWLSFAPAAYAQVTEIEVNAPPPATRSRAVPPVASSRRRRSVPSWTMAQAIPQNATGTVFGYSTASTAPPSRRSPALRPGTRSWGTPRSAALSPLAALTLESTVRGFDEDSQRVDRMAGRGIAIATALASMPDLDSGKRMGFGFGVGSYEGHNAFSAAFVVRASDNAKFRVNAGTAGDSKFAFGAGGMFSW